MTNTPSRHLARYIVFLVALGSSSIVQAQCGPGTPTMVVNLTGAPDSVWVSPLVQRNDNCCGTSAPDQCVKFIITLDPAAQGIAFSIASGAIPGGALFYQINCGPPMSVGGPVCLSGVGPHVLTFCKPGNNDNTYQITSIPGPTAGTNITVNDGCSGSIEATGFDPATVTWNSIFPGASGAYNNYLSCTSGCLTNTVNAQPGFPPFVDYLVCGVPAAQCNLATTCDTVRVTFNPTLSVNITPVNPTICFGQTSVNITANGVGGTPPYTYLWSTGSTSQTIAATAGNYSVIMGDASGCPPVSTSVTVTQFANPITANAGTDIFMCPSQTQVTLAGSVTGTTTGVWSGGSGSFIPNNAALNATYVPTPAEIAAGTLNLTLTTTNNGTCPGASDIVTLNFVTANLAFATTPVTCFGGSDGTASVNVTGAVPVSYSWNSAPVQTTPTATSLPAGNYTVSVTLTGGCVVTGNTTVNQPTQVTGSLTVTPTLCNGQCNGSVTVNASGGTGLLQYSLNGGAFQASPSFTGLCDGPVSITIRDANNCTLVLNDVVPQPAALSVVVNNTTPATCSNSNGTVTVAGNGGTVPYLFSIGGPFVSGTTFTALAGGNYTITVQDDNGCTATVPATVVDATGPVLSVQTQNNLNCFGGSNGMVLLGAAGGTPALSYSITGPVNAGPQASNMFSLLTAGSYNALVTDANGCTSATTFTITQPAQLTYSSTAVPVTCNGACNGQIIISASGGTPAYEYSSNNGLTFQTNDTLSNLCAGNINVVVRDSLGCLANSAVPVTQPAVLNATFVNVNPICFGSCDGQITVNATGGNGGNQFSIDGGPFQAGNVFTGLCAGSHTIQVQDTKGCLFTATPALTNPPAMNINVVSTTASNCGFNDGAFQVSATGPNAIVSYEVPPIFPPQPGGVFNAISGGGYTVFVTDALGCVDSIFVPVNDVQMSATLNSLTHATCFGVCDGEAVVSSSAGAAPYSFELDNSSITQPSGTFVGLCAGNHIVTVYDNGLCVASVVFTVTEPPLITFTHSEIDVVCNGGTTGQIVFSNVTGGTGAYQYSVNGTGGPFQAGATFNGLTAGTYDLAVQDANGCMVTGTATITQATPLLFVVNKNDLTCNGNNSGLLQVVGSGGNPPYQVAVTGALTFPMSPQFTFPGIPAGTYNFTVQDNFGCQVLGSAIISQPTVLSATYTPAPTSCNGSCDGTVQVNASGGTPGYLYSPDNGVTFNVASLLGGLCAGSYTIMVRDDNACTTSSVQVITQPTPVTVSASSTPATCGNSNGTITLTGGGGIPGYQYSNNNAATFQAGNTFTSLPSGTYNIAVRDANNCLASDTISVIDQPSPTLVIVNTTPPLCTGSCDGSASIVASGGTGALQYDIGGALQPSSTFNALCSGTYTATVTDANGCTDVQAFTITIPVPVGCTIVTTDLTCFQNNSGTITLTGNGGAGSYQYSINNGTSFQPGGAFTGLAAGNYTIVVRDANNCDTTATVTLNEPVALTLALSSVSNPTCNGFGNGFITALPGGGTPSYSYLWNTAPAQTAATATGLVAGSYSVTVTDNNGCTIDTSVTLTEPAPMQSFISPADTICLGQTTTLIATATGGSGSYTYSWSPTLGTSGTQNIAPVVTSTFTVTAFDNNGCQANSASVQIVVYNLPGANLTVNALTPICPGTSTLVYATVTGAQGPLSYSWNNGLGPGPGGFLVAPTSPTTYAVTVTNACGATASAQVDVTFNPPPVISFTTDTATGCAPFVVDFTDLSTTVANDSLASWVWNFGDGNTSVLQNPTHIYPSAGAYNVTLSVLTYGGCVNNSNTSPYLITVYPQPNASFAVNSTSLDLPYDELLCTNQSTGAISYLWNFGDGSTTTAVSPEHLYQTIGVFTVSLVATNQFGCTDTAFQQITATSDITFPNAFTPSSSGSNGGSYSIEDLSNDVFFPFTSGVDSYHLMIFNRWGELIFESFELKTGWDGYYRGALCPQDVYVWKADVTFIDGREFKKTGDVTLLR